LDNPQRALLLAPGERVLIVDACQQTQNPLGQIFISDEFVARAALRFEAVAGEVYRAGGDVSKSHDYGLLWIEKASSGEKVAGPVRVDGLRRSLCGVP
jgi:hypothetical protein